MARWMWLIAVAAVSSSSPKISFADITNADRFVRVDNVELAAQDAATEKTPSADTLSLTVSNLVIGCRRLASPKIEKENDIIRVFPQTRSAPCERRGPAAVKSQEQLVKLGHLAPGKYRVHVITARTEIHKVLEVY